MRAVAARPRIAFDCAFPDHRHRDAAIVGAVKRAATFPAALVQQMRYATPRLASLRIKNVFDFHFGQPRSLPHTEHQPARLICVPHAKHREH